jgi:UDP-2,3-diacylglucosamine pyrophosphatase LpxH
MMKIYACSDLHVSPNRFLDQTRAFLEEAAAQGDMTLLCGDVFEGSWFPLQESVEHANGQALLDLIKAQKQPVVIRGNHDWTLANYVHDPEIKIHTNYRFSADGVKYYATHGWAEYDILFGSLAPFYDIILPMLSFLTGWWTARRSPGTLQRKKQTQRYWRLVRRMSNRAIFHCMKMARKEVPENINARRVPLWGHTHHRHIDDYEYWLAINCGDFTEADNGGIVIENGWPRWWTPA